MRIIMARGAEGCSYRTVFKTWIGLVEYRAFSSNSSFLCLCRCFEPKTKPTAWSIKETRIRAIPNSRSSITILKCSERIEEKSCKSNRIIEEIARDNATKRANKMMKITTSSTQQMNEAWRMVRRMRSKFGNILMW